MTFGILIGASTYRGVDRGSQEQARRLDGVDGIALETGFGLLAGAVQAGAHDGDGSALGIQAVDVALADAQLRQKVLCFLF